MPRAIGCFRRVGFPIEAYPVGWRTGRHADLGVPMLFSDALARFDSAAHEWLGLLLDNRQDDRVSAIAVARTKRYLFRNFRQNTS